MNQTKNMHSTEIEDIQVFQYARALRVLYLVTALALLVTIYIWRKPQGRLMRVSDDPSRTSSVFLRVVSNLKKIR